MNPNKPSVPILKSAPGELMLWRCNRGSKIVRQCLASLLLMTAALFVSTGAQAQLAPGAKAPLFEAPAALAGQPFEFDLQSALAQGPAVVYFYPKAFTSGCTIEAQLFAQAMDDFKALGATVVGVSGDDIDTLKKFSEGPCGGKFAVAADPDGQVIDLYDAGFAIIPGMADRISYAIAPDGTILEAFESMSPSQHVSKSLDAIRAWDARQSSQAK
jgi:peroxiredoxin